MFAEADGTLVVGEAALRRAASAPSRVAREYKRRFGDPTPIILGGDSYTSEQLTAAMLRWVVALITEREGEVPARIAVAYPANWGDYKQQLLRGAIVAADLGDLAVDVVTEPEAAVIHYAAQTRVATGSVIAVYDLGGGTFDAAVVRKTDGGAELLGEPEGIERLGGIDFDEAVFRHVAASLGNDMPTLDDADDTLLAAATRLRDECVRAKEALSADTEIDIPVLLPGLHTQVRLTRGEFETMVRAPLNASIAALRRAVANARIEPDELDAVLLVGGSSRIPLVAEMVGSELARPVAVDAHPKHAVALGAALTAAAAADASSEVAPVVAPVGGVEEPPPTVPVAAVEEPPPTVPVAAVPVAAVPASGDGGGRRPPWMLIGIGMALVVGAIAGTIALTSGGGNDGQALSTGGDGATEEAATAPTDAAATTAPAEPTATEAPPPTATSAPTPTATPEPTATPTPEPVCAPEAARCIEMVDVRAEGDAVIVTWEASGFIPSVADGFHAHFYWGVFDAEQVGTNFADFGVVQGDWAAVDAQPWTSTDSGMALSARPAGTDEICVTVGTSVHAVDDPQVFHCEPIPAT